jgi:hypothetical protein
MIARSVRRSWRCHWAGGRGSALKPSAPAWPPTQATSPGFPYLPTGWRVMRTAIPASVLLVVGGHPTTSTKPSPESPPYFGLNRSDSVRVRRCTDGRSEWYPPGSGGISCGARMGCRGGSRPRRWSPRSATGSGPRAHWRTAGYAALTDLLRQAREDTWDAAIVRCGR